MGRNVQCPCLPCRRRDDWDLDDPTGKPDDEFFAIIRTIEEIIIALKAELKDW